MFWMPRRPQEAQGGPKRPPGASSFPDSGAATDTATATAKCTATGSQEATSLVLANFAQPILAPAILAHLVLSALTARFVILVKAY